MSITSSTSLPYNTSLDRSKIPIKALRLHTRNEISTLLNPQKVILTESGIPRDWRGLAHLVGLRDEKIPVIACDNDPTSKVLNLWPEETGICHVNKFLEILEALDRFDVIDDTIELIDEDIQQYLDQSSQEASNPIPLQNSDCHILTQDDSSEITQRYDAYVVFAEEDIHFATELIKTLEDQYGLKLCCKERDLLLGTLEYRAIIELIAERCNRLIVILSPAFTKSNANQFVVNYAQALGIEQGKRKIIPCLYEKCEIPLELRNYFMLDYNRAGKLWNFWEKLRDSIQVSNVASPRQRRNNLPALTVSQVENSTEPHVVNHKKPKKECVRFGSVNNLSIPELEETRLTASTNELYSSPSTTENTNFSLTDVEMKKSKHLSWFKKFLNPKDASKKKKMDSEQKRSSRKEKKKIFSLKKVPVLS